MQEWDTWQDATLGALLDNLAKKLTHTPNVCNTMHSSYQSDWTSLKATFHQQAVAANKDAT